MQIGFIGLGNMGLPMAANLLKHGHEVIGFDLSPAAREAFADKGGKLVESAAAATSGVELVITMLPAGPHVRAVYTDDGGMLAAAAPGTLLIDSSTIDVEAARGVAAAAAARGFDMLDAPVSGGVGGATAGILTFSWQVARTWATSALCRCSRRWAGRSCMPAPRAPAKRQRSATT